MRSKITALKQIVILQLGMLNNCRFNSNSNKKLMRLKKKLTQSLKTLSSEDFIAAYGRFFIAIIMGRPIVMAIVDKT